MSGGVLALTPFEQRLILTLREVPQSPLRNLYTTLVAELTEFVAHPQCAEMQADGAPCTSAATSCDECRKLEALLEGLRTRLQSSS